MSPKTTYTLPVLAMLMMAPASGGQLGSSEAAVISGRVLAETGEGIPGAQVFYRRLPHVVTKPVPGHGFREVSREDVPDTAGIAATDAAGEFAAISLPTGAYTVCVEFPRADFLGSCSWGSARIVTLSRSEPRARLEITAPRSATVEVGINDRQRLLEPAATPLSRPGIVVGVFSGDGSYHALKTEISDANSRLLRLAVPVGMPLRLHVFTRDFILTDDVGRSVDGMSTSVPFSLPAAATRMRYSLNITARR